LNEIEGVVSTSSEEFFHGQLDIAQNLSEKYWRNIAARMEGNGCVPSIGMSELFVRAFLTYFDKPQLLQRGNNLPGLQDRQHIHG